MNADLTWQVTSGGPSGNPSPAPAPALLTVANPNNQVIPTSSLSAFMITGTCVGSGSSVTLSGAVSATVTCGAGVWFKQVSFVAASDGNLSITATLVTSPPMPSPVTASVNLIKDTQAPAAPALGANVPVTFTTQLPLTWTGSDVGLAGLDPLAPYNLIVYSAAGCTGAPFATVSPSSASYTVAGLSNGSSYSYKVSAKDAAGNVGAYSSCSGTTLVATAPATITYVDPTATAGYALSVAGSTLTIGADAGATLWCISETQTSAPSSGSANCMGGLGGSNGWYAARPGTFTLSAGDGPKLIYLWIADSAGGVKAASPSPAAIILHTQRPSTFSVSSVLNGADQRNDAYLLDTSSGTATINWTTPTSDLDHFQVQITDLGGVTPYCSASGNLVPATVSFQLSGCTLANGTTYLAVVYAFNIAGGQTIITKTFTVSIPSTISATPPTYSGSVTYPTQGSQVIHLAGSSTLISATVSTVVSTNPDFVVNATGCIGVPLLSSGGGCNLTVTFTPFAGGTESATLTIVYDNGENGSVTTSASESYTVTAAAVSVIAAYTNGSNWNDYIKNVTPSLASYLQPSGAAACAGTEAAYSACIHGGEIRRVNAPVGVTSCTGLTITDTLGVFDWVCDASTNPVAFYSTGLKAGKFLASLLNGAGTGWNTDAVTIKSGSNTLMQSTPAAWWGNPVGNAPASGSLGATASEIFTVTSNLGSAGLQFGAAKQALVIYPGAELRYAGSVTNCSTTGVGTDSKTAVCGGASGSPNKFVWLEGVVNSAFSAGHAGIGVLLYAAKFSTLRAVTAKGGDTYGIYGNYSDSARLINSQVQSAAIGVLFENANGMYMSNVTATGCGNDGIDIFVGSSTLTGISVARNGGSGLYINGNSNTVSQVDAAANGNDGVQVDAVNGTHLRGLRTMNNSSDGLRLLGSTNTVVVQALVTGNFNGIGIWSGASKNTLHQITVAQNGVNLNSPGQNTAGIYFDDSGAAPSQNFISNALLGNNYSGVYVGSNALNNQLNNIVASNGYYVAELNGATNTKFSGYLRGGNAAGTSECYVSGGSAPGLINNTCTDSGGNGTSSYTGQFSTAKYYTGSSLVSSFVGKALTDVAAGGAVAAYNSISSWFTLDAPTRVWGRTTGLAYDDPGTRDQCISGGNCQVWDYALGAVDTVVLNRSGDGVTLNDPYVPGGACPSQVAGNQVTTDLEGSPVTFLTNAIEASVPGSGNGNGLCESGEICVYAANVGAYIGHGASALAPCTFSNGTVSGVTMVAPISNGY